VETSTYDADNRLASRDINVPNGPSGSDPESEMMIQVTDQNNGQISTLKRYSVMGAANDVPGYMAANLNGNVTAGIATYLYDAAERLTTITHDQASSTGAILSVLASYTYNYDFANRLTSEVDDGATIGYSYDNANQLTQA